VSGYVSTADGGAGTKTTVLKLGSTTIVTGTSPNTLTNTLNYAWDAEATITCRTTGGSGTVVGNTTWRISNTNAQVVGTFGATTSAVTVDTTATQTIDMTFNNGNATGAIRTTQATVEVIN